MIGGTSESAAVARALFDADVPYVVTVTTEAARQLYPSAANVWVGQLSANSIAAFIQRWQVKCILDASHPFASEISRLAIAIANQSAELPGAAYLRYERTEICQQSSSQQSSSQQSLHSKNDAEEHPDRKSTDTDSAERSIISPITSISSLGELLDSSVFSQILRYQRILFTLGCRQLSQFSSHLDRLRQTSQLFVRVLPSIEALSAALAAGFSTQEIVAIRPPISPALERALWQQWQISVVIAKASGIAGGEVVKRAIALELGVHLILIRRPSIIYPQQTNLISEAVEFCAETLRLY
nr:precorrin-6A/cobalt-precorrin-6A reductase [cf. Phormidesmis sp. LEGE 11477]